MTKIYHYLIFYDEYVRKSFDLEILRKLVELNKKKSISEKNLKIPLTYLNLIKF